MVFDPRRFMKAFAHAGMTVTVRSGLDEVQTGFEVADELAFEGPQVVGAEFKIEYETSALQLKKKSSLEITSAQNPSVNGVYEVVDVPRRTDEFFSVAYLKKQS